MSLEFPHGAHQRAMAIYSGNVTLPDIYQAYQIHTKFVPTVPDMHQNCKIIWYYQFSYQNHTRCCRALVSLSRKIPARYQILQAHTRFPKPINVVELSGKLCLVLQKRTRFLPERAQATKRCFWLTRNGYAYKIAHNNRRA